MSTVALDISLRMLEQIGQVNLVVVDSRGERSPLLGRGWRNESIWRMLRQHELTLQWDTRRWLVFAPSWRQAMGWARVHQMPRDRYLVVQHPSQIKGMLGTDHQHTLLPGWADNAQVARAWDEWQPWRER